MLSKKEKIKLLDSLQGLSDVLRTITNKLVKASAGVEPYIELSKKLDDIDNKLKELKK